MSTGPHLPGKDEMHQFWDTQPVLRTYAQGETVAEGPLETKTLADVPKEPYAIASTFEWWSPNISNVNDLQAIHELLRDNYVEDDSSMFRFHYSIDFLRWALAPPGYIHDWHVGIRRKSDKKLLAFISGIPYTTKMGEKTQRICEINFLCIHKNLREKRLAPILIKEVTRRVNLLDIWQAIYTAGKVIPTPFATANYFHRTIDPEKLVAIRFSRIPAAYDRFSNPMQMMKRHYNLPAKPAGKGLRPMKKEDAASIAKILNEQLNTYRVAAIFTEEEVAHWLMPRKDVVYTYVVPTETGVSDFFSFYNLPSTVIGNPKYDNLRAAYIFYYGATKMDLKNLINDLLIKARDEKFDVVNCVDILQSATVIDDLKFVPGDGSLHYYFYNWSFPPTPPKEVGFVML